MKQETELKQRWGGPRPGAGRPKGSGNKIKIEDLIDSIEAKSGMSFPDQIASNYAAAINRGDWARVENYDKALLNTIVADKSEIVLEDSTNILEAKQVAFREAIQAIANINNIKDNTDATD